MKTLAVLVVGLAVLVPADVEAQRRSQSCCSSNPFSFSPYAGVYDDAYDHGADGSVGWQVGFRAGYHESQRLTVYGNIGYAQANDVAPRTPLENWMVDNRWITLTGGAEFALVPGNTSVAVGAEAGVAWRQSDLHDGWVTHDVLAPGLTLRHHFSPGTSVFVAAQDYILDVFDGRVQHSPSLKLGLSFR